MPNMYDSAYDLEKAIRESEEFIDLKNVYEEVMNDPKAKEMFEAFRQTQMELQEKQMQGVDISEEEVQKAQSIVESVQNDQKLSTLMEKEQRLNFIINDISSIITKPFEELYGQQKEAE